MCHSHLCHGAPPASRTIAPSRAATQQWFQIRKRRIHASFKSELKAVTDQCRSLFQVGIESCHGSMSKSALKFDVNLCKKKIILWGCLRQLALKWALQFGVSAIRSIATQWYSDRSLLVDIRPPCTSCRGTRSLLMRNSEIRASNRISKCSDVDVFRSENEKARSH